MTSNPMTEQQPDNASADAVTARLQQIRERYDKAEAEAEAFMAKWKHALAELALNE